MRPLDMNECEHSTIELSTGGQVIKCIHCGELWVASKFNGKEFEYWFNTIIKGSKEYNAKLN